MARAAVTWVGLREMLLADVAKRGPEHQSTALAALARATREELRVWKENKEKLTTPFLGTELV